MRVAHTLGEIVAGKPNAETERDYGTNCRDCERFQRVGEVCVIEHGKRFLWEYCRDFEAKVELPDYNELMKTVRQEHAIQLHKEREKKEREKKQRLKEREAKKELARRARIARARRKYFAKLKEKKAAAEKRKKERERKKQQQLESTRPLPPTGGQTVVDSRASAAVGLDLGAEPRKESAINHHTLKVKRKRTLEDNGELKQKSETVEETQESKSSVTPNKRREDGTTKATDSSRDRPKWMRKSELVISRYEEEEHTAVDSRQPTYSSKTPSTASSASATA